MSMTTVEILKRNLTGMSVGDAMWLLSLYGCLGHSVWLGGQWVSIYRLDEYLFMDEVASIVKLRFLGGPNKTWFWGDLEMLTLDRVMQGNTKGVGCGWIIMRHDKTEDRSVCEQLGQYVPAALSQVDLLENRSGSIYEEPATTMNDREYDDIPFDVDDPIVDRVELGEAIIEIHESGRQSVGALPVSDNTARGDRNYKWSSSGRTNVVH